ncbi:MAG: ketoacyl-ACP synthase III [Nevskia sp.]|nr:ketoacyl-ACP synthase III [Nevskia sp.]
MIGIQAIFTEIPAERLDNAPREVELRLKEGTLEKRIGVRRIARKAPEQETSDLCVAAALKLFASGLASRSQVDCLIVVTQNPDGHGLPQTSAIVHGKLGLQERCAAFDIGLGCSGYVYALSIAKSFMEANGLSCGLLFTADPYSPIIDRDDRRTALLFGDAAAVTLLSDQPRWTIGRFDMGTIGGCGQALEVRLNRDGKLYMDGKAVLSFSVSKVPASLQNAVRLNGLTVDRIDRFVLHQGSRVVVESIGQALNAPEKVEFYAEDYGNTVSSSIPIALSQNLKPGDRHVAISGFGVGLSWASTVISRLD